MNQSSKLFFLKVLKMIVSIFRMNKNTLNPTNKDKLCISLQLMNMAIDVY